MQVLDFWFDFASTYSYPTVMPISPLAAAHGVTVRWHPLLLGPVFQAQGLATSPFNVFPVKGAYMLRDLQRLCRAQNLPFVWPAELNRSGGFPRRSILAARIGLIGFDEGWGKAFARATFVAEFGHGKDIADPAVIGKILSGLNLEPQPVLGRAQNRAVKDPLRSNTDRAIRLGIFGAPSFSIGTELFWGNDRLLAALDWASQEK